MDNGATLVGTVTQRPRDLGDGLTLRAATSELASFPTLDTLRVRPATESDAAFLASIDAEASLRYAVWAPRDAAQWRYELTGHREGSAVRSVISVIEDTAGRAVGMVAHAAQLWGTDTVGVHALEVARGISWRPAVVAAFHYLRATGEALAARKGRPFGGVSLWLQRPDHPLYEVLRLRYSAADSWYALYTRVADVAAFLRAVVPALERRVAGSPLTGHSGELRVSFYRDGVRVALEGGRVTTVERWQPSHTLVGQEMGIGTTDHRRPSALFPELTFLQLLFGLRSADDLVAWYPDCVIRTAETRALLNALFPRQPSFVWPVL
jgi:hypothetical protein